jgi:hypothetical protein
MVVTVIWMINEILLKKQMVRQFTMLTVVLIGEFTFR